MLLVLTCINTLHYFRKTRMDYKYTCDVCEKSYNHKSSLERHKRRHTGKKVEKDTKTTQNMTKNFDQRHDRNSDQWSSHPKY